MTRTISRLTLLVAIATVLCTAQVAAAADHRLGLGLHYWQSLDDLADDFPGVEDSGVSWLASYLVDPAGILKFIVDLEYYPDGFGGSKAGAWSPQAYVLIGDKFYGGVGIGTTFASSFENNRSETFYIGRFGVDFTLLPRLRLDVNLTYRADAFNELQDFESDALTLGAVFRVKLSSGGDD